MITGKLLKNDQVLIGTGRSSVAHLVSEDWSRNNEEWQLVPFRCGESRPSNVVSRNVEKNRPVCKGCERSVTKDREKRRRRLGLGPQQIRIEHCDSLEHLKETPDGVYEMVIGSPPYCFKTQRYGSGRKMTLPRWVDWFVDIIVESVRVSRGFVWFVVDNPIKSGLYVPSIEMVQVKLYEMGLMLERPCIWWKNAAPQRKGKYFSHDYEWVICVKPITYPQMNWEAVAEPPKFKKGGRFRQRNKDGTRPEAKGEYPGGSLANPKDVFYCTVGGGHMGFDKVDSEFSSRGHAPYPIDLASRFVQVGSSEGGTVFDPFVGSATTAIACLLHDRKFVGCEIDKAEYGKALARVERTRVLLESRQL